MMKDVDIDNVGIMSGFTEDFDSTLAEALSDEGLGGEEEGYETGKIMDRKPDSPEILMNNLRGDMRSVDARREELADMVGYGAAMETPDEVLAILQDHFAMMDQGPAMGIGALPEAPQQPAPPPMAQGPAPQQPPINMAKGGYVQNFALGSNEDGVTPADNTSYGTLAPNLRSQVQDILLKQLQTKNTPVPTRQQAMDEMLPLYQQMLGGDNKANKAAALFALSEGFANLGSKGGSGSFASKMLDSFKGVPTKLGELGMKQKERDQAIKMAALKAGEENRSAIIAANTKADENRVDAAKELLKNSSGIGDFKARWEWKITSDPKMRAAYMDGSLPEEQLLAYENALSKLLKPREEERTDPVTGRTYTVRIPGYKTPSMIKALEARQENVGDAGVYIEMLGAAKDTSALPVTDPTAKPEGEDKKPAEITAGDMMPSPLGKNYYDKDNFSMFGMAEKGAGTFNVTKAFLERYPILKDFVDGEGNLTAKAFAKASILTAKRGFSELDKFGFSDSQLIQNELDLLPGLLEDQTSYREKIIGIDMALAKGLQSMERTMQEDKVAGRLTADKEKAFLEKMSDVRRTRYLLGAPPWVNRENGDIKKQLDAIKSGQWYILGSGGTNFRLVKKK